MKKFEYKVLDVPLRGFWRWSVNYQELTDKLNQLGKEGWEAVSVDGISIYSHSTRALVVILKKEID